MPMHVSAIWSTRLRPQRCCASWPEEMEGSATLPCFVAGRDERQRVKPQRRKAARETTAPPRLASPAGLLVQARALAHGARYPLSAPIDVLLMQILAGAQSAAAP